MSVIGANSTAPTRIHPEGQEGLQSRMEEQNSVTGLMSPACDVTAVFFRRALPEIGELLQAVCQPGTRSVQCN